MMQNAAILWHVSLLVAPEKKALALGAVGLVKVIPIVVFSLVGGVVGDAVDRRKMMLLMQTLMTVLAGVLAYLTFSGAASFASVCVLTAASSAAFAFDNPARQSLVPALVPAKHLPNALSLNSILFQAGSVAGPGLAGIVMGSMGIGWVYLINAT